MTDDKELIARLRDEQPVTQDFQHTLKCALMDAAADRIEQLVATNEALTAERDEQIEWVKRLADDLILAEAKLAKAVEALEHAKLNMPHPDQMIDDTIAALKGESHD